MSSSSPSQLTQQQQQQQQQQQITVLLSDALFRLWSATSPLEQQRILTEDVSAALLEARPLVEKITAIVVDTKQRSNPITDAGAAHLTKTLLHQFCVLSLASLVKQRPERFHRPGGLDNRAGNEEGPKALAAVQQIRHIVGWIRSSSSSATGGGGGGNSFAALCVATQAELIAATVSWSTRHFQSSYESFLAARSQLCELISASFPPHNGNPPAYLLYFLVVSLAAVYHNLAVVAKHLQRYDAALLWMLHFVRIAALVRNDASPELEELKEPLCTRAGLARQFVLPVLAGVTSLASPFELVARVKAVVESGKSADSRRRLAEEARRKASFSSSSSSSSSLPTSSGATESSSASAESSSSRGTASRLAIVQSFAERYFAGAMLQRLVAKKIAAGGANSSPLLLLQQSARCRVEAADVFWSISPGDTAEEISRRLAPLSVPRATSSRVGGNSSSSSSSDQHGSSPKGSLAALLADEEAQKFCEEVTAAVASAVTSGAIKSCDAMAIGDAVAEGTFDVQRLDTEVRHLLFAGIDFSSVGGEHSAMGALTHFFVSERSDICEVIAADLKVLAGALNSDSWLDNSSDEGAADQQQHQFAAATVILDFESALEVFCSEFDLLLAPLCLDVVRANAIGLFDIGGVPLHLGHSERERAAAAGVPAQSGAMLAALTAASATEKTDSNKAVDGSKTKQNPGFTPKIINGSGLLLTNDASRAALHKSLPLYVQHYDWICKFSSRTHGSSFSKLFDRCAGLSPLLLVVAAVAVNDTESSSAAAATAFSSDKLFTFGAFIGGPLQPASSTGPSSPGGAVGSPPTTVGKVTSHRSNFSETFVFREVGGGGEIQCFHHVEGTNRTFVECNSERIQIGAAGIDSAVNHGAAIFLPAWLRAGSTFPCDTFASPPLMESVSSSFTFKPCAVEVFCFGTS